MVDIGATHNFIDARFVERRGIMTEEFEGLPVQVADGYTLKCNRMVRNLPLRLNNYKFRWTTMLSTWVICILFLG